MKRILQFTYLISFTSCVLTILGRFGHNRMFLDILSNFNFQFFIVNLICVIILVLAKKKWLPALLTIFMLLSYHPIIKAILEPTLQRNDSQKTTSVTSINLLGENSDHDKVKSFINEKDPEILILQEYTESWDSTLLPTLTRNYPFQKAHPRKDNLGICVCSKVAPESSQIIYLSEDNIPSILCEYNINNKKVAVLAVHLLPPKSIAEYQIRNKHLNAIAELSKTYNSFMVIGDLNITPYSSHFIEVLNTSDLVDSRKGFGMQASWPTWSFLFWIPIDHCLHTSDIKIIDRKIGPNVGSDHYPVSLMMQ